VRALGAADKAAALKETREFALEIYKDPDQLEHEVYAADAGAKGEMPADFPKLGAAYRRADLETAAAAP
jgi:hypothetical protein